MIVCIVFLRPNEFHATAELPAVNQKTSPHPALAPLFTVWGAAPGSVCAWHQRWLIGVTEEDSVWDLNVKEVTCRICFLQTPTFFVLRASVKVAASHHLKQNKLWESPVSSTPPDSSRLLPACWSASFTLCLIRIVTFLNAAPSESRGALTQNKQNYAYVTLLVTDSISGADIWTN